jgi:murein DD-endopeptidase MepM/ murein hydrolase activator NlpD
MEFQFHPGSARATVRTLPLSNSGQRALVLLSGLLALLAISLWFTVPLVLAHQSREDLFPRLSQEIAARRAEREEVIARAQALKRRVLDTGDLLNRIAFLYDLPSAAWPRLLNPERPVLISDDPDRAAATLDLYLRGLEKAREMLEQRERTDPDLARRAPAIFPFAGTPFEPSSFFGPRVSPWTGAEEFFPGVDLSAPAGSAVVAPGGGTVVFAGTMRRSATDWFWRLGNVVVVSHGDQGATLYGHLARIEVKRGQRVARGQRLGAVGSTGWAISSQLHYEYWRRTGESLRPTDPLFIGLDRRSGQRLLSLEQMEATSAPGPLDPLPGIEVSAEKVGGKSAAAPPRRRSRRRPI